MNNKTSPILNVKGISLLKRKILTPKKDIFGIYFTFYWSIGLPNKNTLYFGNTKKLAPSHTLFPQWSPVPLFVVLPRTCSIKITNNNFLVLIATKICFGQSTCHLWLQNKDNYKQLLWLWLLFWQTGYALEKVLHVTWYSWIIEITKIHRDN